MNSIIFSLINSFLFLIIKCIDSRFIKKEKISIKLLMKDTTYVFIVSYITIFLSKICIEFNVFDDQKVITPAFTGNAEF